MNIEECMEILSHHSRKFIERRLHDVLEEINFLESIYMGDGANHHYSTEFNNAAHEERQKLCQISSACFHILGYPGHYPSKYHPADESEWTLHPEYRHGG